MEEGAVGVYLNTKYWKVKFYSRLICPVFSSKDTKWIYLKQCYSGKIFIWQGRCEFADTILEQHNIVQSEDGEKRLLS